MDKQEAKEALKGKTLIIDGEFSLSSLSTLLIAWVYNNGFEICRKQVAVDVTKIVNEKPGFMEAWADFEDCAKKKTAAIRRLEAIFDKFKE